MAMPIATPPPPIRLTVLGTRFNPGSRITVHVVAPPNGQAFALVCDSAQRYRLVPSKAAPTTYTGTVPAPLTASELSCPISAEFYDANGIWSYVAQNAPIFIGAPIVEPAEVETADVPETRDHDHKHNDKSRATPAPTPTPTRIQQPVAPRATPTPAPPPRYRRDPIVSNTPGPRPADTPAPRSVEQPAPVERVAPPPAQPRVEPHVDPAPEPKSTKAPA